MDGSGSGFFKKSGSAKKPGSKTLVLSHLPDSRKIIFSTIMFFKTLLDSFSPWSSSPLLPLDPRHLSTVAALTILMTLQSSSVQIILTATTLHTFCHTYKMKSMSFGNELFLSRRLESRFHFSNPISHL